MSAATSRQSGWLAQNYEKIAVMVVLVAVLVSALFLVIRIGMERKVLAEGERLPGAPKKVEAVDLTRYDPQLEVLHSPFQATVQSNNLMVSELRVWSVNPEHIPAPIPYNATVCPFTGAPQPPVVPIDKRDTDSDLLPNGYEEKYGLDPRSADDALLDLDGDGFNNLEEFQSGTDPSDPKDFPDLPAKLRLVGARTIPFVLRFQGIQELADGKRFLLNLRSLKRSHFVKVGDEVEGFQVVKFDENAADGPTLTLRKGKDSIDLVRGRRVDKDEVVALLVFLLDGSRYKIRIGDTITLRQRSYKVVDIKPDTVSIQDAESRKVYRVGLLSQSEKNELLGLPEEPDPTQGLPPEASQ